MQPIKRERLPAFPTATSAESQVVKKKPVPVSANDGAIFLKNIDLTGWELPEEKNQPISKMEELVWLIYGEQKIGKTSLISQFKDVLFFSFEAGTKNNPVYATKPITDWRQFLFIIDQLEDKFTKGTLPYTMGCLDTGHAAYDRALEYVCARDGIRHPGKIKDYGATWKEILTEFASAHTRLVSIGMGLAIISHSRTRERDDRFGSKYDRIEPCFSESAELYYKAISDVTGYYQIVNGQRFLLIQPQDDVIAGHRVDGHFKTKTGENISMIPMGENVREAFQNLKTAFNNQQLKQNRMEELTGKTIKKIVRDNVTISGT